MEAPIVKPNPKPTIYIPVSDQAAEEKERLRRMMGVVYPEHGTPSAEDILVPRQLGQLLHHQVSGLGGLI